MTTPYAAEKKDPLRSEHLLDGVRVLVVDDDPELRDAIGAVLASSGADVVAVASAREALRAIGRAAPDVLLSDIAMPGMDGCGLIHRVRELPLLRGARTPALALTAYATPAGRVHALLSGYQLYLAKPFEALELVAMVARLAGQRRAAALSGSGAGAPPEPSEASGSAGWDGEEPTTDSAAGTDAIPDSVSHYRRTVLRAGRSHL